jgi:GTPase SAR1 family protein
MLLEKLCQTLFNEPNLPDNVKSCPIEKVVLFSTKQREILQSKGIKTIENLANIWSKLDNNTIKKNDLPLETLEKASAAARLLIRSIDLEQPSSVSDALKIVIVGLDKAGKSSILSILKKGKRLLEIRLLINRLMPTVGEAKERLNIAGVPVNMHELGGREDYRKLYLENPEEYFLNSHALIYVFDLQDTERYDISILYLKKVKDLLNFLDITLPIYCFLHKYEPEVVEKEQIDNLKRELTPLTNHIFVTSIYEPSTIANAFTLILQSVLPVTHWLNEGLTRLAIEELKTPYLSIIDKGIVLGEYSAFMYSTTVKIREKIQNELYNRDTNKKFYLMVEKFSLDPKKSLFLVLSDFTVNNLNLVFAAITLTAEEGAKLNRDLLSESITRRVGTEIKFLTITNSALSLNPNFKSDMFKDAEWRNQD